MIALETLLHGGDVRTLHGVANVVDIVLHEPARFDELVACLSHDDATVRMRAADAAEKVTRARPELLPPHRAALVELAATTEQPSLRWHLAEMLPRMRLDPNEERAAVALLRRYLDDRSAIVKVAALQALADLTECDPSLRRPVVAAIRAAVATGSAAVRSRGEKLLGKLERGRAT